LLTVSLPSFALLTGATGNSEEVKALADEIVAHLRGLVGADALLAAYQAARGAVRRQRGERKRAAAVQVRAGLGARGSREYLDAQVLLPLKGGGWLSSAAAVSWRGGCWAPVARVPGVAVVGGLQAWMTAWPSAAWVRCCLVLSGWQV